MLERTELIKLLLLLLMGVELHAEEHKVQIVYSVCARVLYAKTHTTLYCHLVAGD